MLAALAIFLAAIVSDDATMFINHGDWLPKQVPNECIYDSPDPSGKVLSTSTNVAAAVASCVSALCERMVIGCGNGRSWWEYYGPEVLGEETFKTNDLCAGDYYSFWRATDRSAESYRILAYDRIGRIREDLCGMTRYDPIYNTYCGSSWLMAKCPDGGEFPSWSWTTNSPVDVFGKDAWRYVWPQYASCTNDHVWKVVDDQSHYAPYEPLDWLNNVFYYDFEDVRTNGVDLGCLDLLIDRIGTNAVKFASETQRMSYYRIGAIECALASMDVTYDRGNVSTPPFKFEHVTHRHDLGYDSEEYNTGVSVDYANGYITIDDDTASWEPHETWTTTTNKTTSSYEPFFVCSGDTPSAVASIVASQSLYIKEEYLSTYVSDLAGRPGDTLILKVEQSGIGLIIRAEVPGNSSYGTPDSGDWNINRRVGVSRTIGVDFTDDFTNSCVSSVERPVPWVWSNRLLRNMRVNALESRVVVTNRLPHCDSGGDYNTTNIDYDEAQHRSVLIGQYAYKPNLLSMYELERRNHRNEVESYLTRHLGCSLKNREALIPIDPADAARLRDEANRQRKIPIVVKRSFGIGWFWTVNGIWTYKLDNGKSDILYPGSRLQVGELTAEWSYELNNTETKGRQPCHSNGFIQSVERLKWKFRNLHEE